MILSDSSNGRHNHFELIKENYMARFYANFNLLMMHDSFISKRKLF